MPTLSKTQAGNQHFSELWGQVIGIYGDPTNQDITANGVTQAQAFLNITWGGSDLQKALFWSRCLLCIILNPFDSSYHRAKIALVLRPRSLWLFTDSGGSKIADYAGNLVDANSVGTSNADGHITSVNPAYNFGDMIRIGVLPSALNVSNWSDDFTKLYNEFYDSQVARQRDFTLAVSSMTINAAGFVPSIASFSASKIVYYDKNTDARTRIVGASSGGDVTLPVCMGGVTAVYKLKGTRLS